MKMRGNAYQNSLSFKPLRSIAYRVDRTELAGEVKGSPHAESRPECCPSFIAVRRMATSTTEYRRTPRALG